MRNRRRFALAALAAAALVGCAGQTTGTGYVTATSARLYGSGTCQAAGCSVYVRWRRAGTTAWTNGPVLSGLGALTSPVPFFTSATGLLTGADYEYQVCGAERGDPVQCAGPDGQQGSTEHFRTFASPWAIEDAPFPAGDSLENRLTAVSCPSAGACLAVGRSRPGVAFAVRRDATGWTAAPFPGGTFLPADVSCSGPAACTVVGSGFASPAQRLDGSGWTGQPVPVPSGSSSVSLSGVSCPSATACVAVGAAGGSAVRDYAAVWDGSAWTLTPTPANAGTFGLSAVSCSAPSACTAVGNRPGGAFALRWDGSTWASQALPAVGTDTALNAVACPNATACRAVGYYATAAGEQPPLALRWDGAAWVRDAVPGTVSPDHFAPLRDIACTSASACAAVGFDEDQTGGVRRPVVVAARWDGTAWTADPISNGAPGSNNELAGLSCAPGSTACVAVGTQGFGAFGNSADRLLVERRSN